MNLDNTADIKALITPKTEETQVPAVIEEPALPATIAPEVDEVEEDFALARETMRSLLDKSEELLDGISSLAKDAEHPRAYEVAGQLINNVASVAKDLIGLQKTKREIREPKQDSSGSGQVTHNNQIEQAVFVGSTADLLKQVSNKPKEVVDATVIHSAPAGGNNGWYSDDEDDDGDE